MPEFFHLLGRVSVKYVATSQINLARGRKSSGAGGGDGVLCGIFPRIIKG
jgi:hypothetical protein